MPPEPKLGAGSTERAACCHLHVKVKLPLTNTGVINTDLITGHNLVLTWAAA